MTLKRGILKALYRIAPHGSAPRQYTLDLLRSDLHTQQHIFTTAELKRALTELEASKLILIARDDVDSDVMLYSITELGKSKYGSDL